MISFSNDKHLYVFKVEAAILPHYVSAVALNVIQSLFLHFVQVKGRGFVFGTFLWQFVGQVLVLRNAGEPHAVFWMHNQCSHMQEANPRLFLLT